MKLSTKIQCEIRTRIIADRFDMQIPDKVEHQIPSIQLPASWTIGTITGPSGSGKSTLARTLFRGISETTLDEKKTIIDTFPTKYEADEIIKILTAVGFASPPEWIKPVSVLSTGQRMRCQLALALATAVGTNEPVIFDEFTSTVDRQVAAAICCPLQKCLRQRNQKFIAVSCHRDFIEHLNPDWVYDTESATLTRRELQPRPKYKITIQRAHHSRWALYAHHHYLDHDINHAAKCWEAFVETTPVAFTAWLPFFGRRKTPARREHRTVVKPDWQGIGIGAAIVKTIASMYAALGIDALSTTTHPSVNAHREKSPDWTRTRAPALAPLRHDKVKHATTRLTTGWKYIGPPMPATVAWMLER